MAAKNLLTAKHLKSIVAGETEHWISDGGGLYLRVYPITQGGTITFVYRYSVDKKRRKLALGDYPLLSLADAREKRDELARLVQSGIDPIEQEKRQKEAVKAADALAKMEKTVEQLYTDWMEHYVSIHRKDGGEEVKYLFEKNVIPELGDMKAKDVRRAHVRDVLNTILKRGANRLTNVILSLLRQMFRYGIEIEAVEIDPTAGLSKKTAGGKDKPRDRNLSFDELAELRKQMPAANLHEKYEAAIWFLLSTGPRVDAEFTSARLSEFNLKKATWTIPAEHSKNGKEHLIHLSDFALKQLKRLMEYSDGEWLIVGRKESEPISEKQLTKIVRDRNRTAPLKGRTKNGVGALILSGGTWTPHDLRRTMASRMGDLGIDPHVIERCLNHVDDNHIKQVYQRQKYMEERKAAFGIWGGYLERLTANEPNVVEMAEKKKKRR